MTNVIPEPTKFPSFIPASQPCVPSLGRARETPETRNRPDEGWVGTWKGRTKIEGGTTAGGGETRWRKTRETGGMRAPEREREREGG